MRVPIRYGYSSEQGTTRGIWTYIAHMAEKRKNCRKYTKTSNIYTRVQESGYGGTHRANNFLIFKYQTIASSPNTDSVMYTHPNTHSPMCTPPLMYPYSHGAHFTL